MFTDILLELPIKNYKDYNLVIHGYKELDYNQKGWVEFKHWHLLASSCSAIVNGLWICSMYDLQWAPSVLSKLKLG
jgi:xyloglucan 6-xylosyltransferase